MESKLCQKEQCTACYACINACPKKCISMTKDKKRQALYPEIDYNICINCGACTKACPSLNTPQLNKPSKVFAAVSKDEEIYVNSTSGGVAFSLSKKIIEDGGVVYSTSYTDNLEVVLKRYKNIDDLKKSQGSKYLHSHINNAYRQIKEDLINNTTVLFIGLPCQVAGLYGFLNHKKFDNLLTIDLICHGTPDYTIFNEYSKYILKAKYNKAVYAKFRESTSDGINYTINYVGNNENSLSNNPHRQNIYITHFLDGIIYRENCYNCIYARPERVSDITLGDFWGLEENALEINIQRGVSCVLLNTEKGANFFYNNIDDFYTAEKSFDDVAEKNKQLKHPTEKNKYYYRFEKLLTKGNVVKALKYCNLKKYMFILIRKFINNNKLMYAVFSKTNLVNKL